MASFQCPLEELKDYTDMSRVLREKKGPLLVSGCIDSQRVHLACSLGKDYPLSLIVTYQESRAKEIYEDAKCFTDSVWFYPAKDLLFYQADIHGNVLMQQRMAVWQQMLEEGSGVIVTTIDACMDQVAPAKLLRSCILSFSLGDTLDIEDFKRKMAEMGYERLPQADAPGQFAVRGDIVDVYPLTAEAPVRVELWDDEIDSIRVFDPESQRSLENLDEFSIYPAVDILEGEMNKETLVSFLDYFPPDAPFFLDEPDRLMETANAVSQEFRESMTNRLEKGYVTAEELPALFTPEQVTAILTRPRTVLMTGLEQKGGSIRPAWRFFLAAQTVNSYQNSFEMLIADLKKWKRDKARVVLLAGSRTRAERLAHDLQEYELASFYTGEEDQEVQPGQVLVTYGNIHKGFAYPAIRFYILSEGDLFGKEKKKRRKKTTYEGKHIQEFSQLSVGDYVIHENHGLGIYQGTSRMTVGGVEKDYMKITYGDGGNLYIPVTQMNLVQKYAGADAEKVPKLNRLGGAEWHKTKTRVKKAVKEVAADLIRLYAARHNGKGFACGPDTVWQKEFEDQFPYEATDDQLAAIAATKADMESDKIMDRLICGDVGFGKTEIAIRAAFKAVQESKQVAYLVPTTILAQQHYNTFAQRLKDYPAEVGLLCRFCTPAEQKKSLERLAEGKLDILIGTHRILSKDVKFKDLGLLIIDEEQRFGVSDKEKIKKLKESVDVLTLTATPIPRTLHMSMIGIRDMSVLEEAPVDRVPIQTYVMEYNDEMVREAISREMTRGGQIYYVYNQVRTIAEMTDHIAALVPEATVVFAHGQMKERELERIMLDFINGEIDVLVSTTIIETGLDISNVNTIIIHDADRFGLSQLYQLRGRVGRSSRTAYAFLMYRRDRMLREVAEKRLSAIREYTELGSGIKIAMRDLELRGAGNLLGAEQHGHMEAVGYDLYCKLLGMAVQELKGEKVSSDAFETTIDLQVDAFIPDTYIRNEAQKMSVYKKIAAVETEEDLTDMQDELIDRFGDLPRAVQNLIRVALIRSLAHEAYVTELSGNREELKFQMYKEAPVDPSRIADFLAPYRGDIRVSVGPEPCFTYRDQRKRIVDTPSLLDVVRQILTDMQGLVATNTEKKA